MCTPPTREGVYTVTCKGVHEYVYSSCKGGRPEENTAPDLPNPELPDIRQHQVKIHLPFNLMITSTIILNA